MPERRPYRVLVVIVGSRAEFVGTTLAAFLSRDAASVDELHVLTSLHTSAQLRTNLLRSRTGTDPLTDLCNRLGVIRGDILFGSRTIHGLGNSHETSGVGAAADDMLDAFRVLCAGDGEVTAVAAPDAGAFGIIAHAALQLAGRPKDRFFFLDFDPGQAVGKRKRGARRGASRAQRPTDTRGVVLLELPMVLASRPFESTETFRRLAASARLGRQRLAEPSTLFLNGASRTVRVDETELTMPRLQFFWLFALATLAPRAILLRSLTGNFQVDGHGHVTITAASSERAALEALIGSLRKVFTALFPHAAEEFPRVLKLSCGMSPGLPSIVAKINARLRQGLGSGAAPYLVSGGRSVEGYRLTLPSTGIKAEPHVHLAHTRS